MRKCRNCEFLDQSMAGNLLCSKKAIGKNIVRLHDSCDIKKLKDKSSNNERFIELMKELKSLIVFNNLQENVIQCPTCAGLRIVPKQDVDGSNYIIQCDDCYNGIVHVCPFCGKHNKMNNCNCHEYYLNEGKKEQEKENEYFEKMKSENKIIPVADYNSFVVWGDNLIDKDDLEERIKELLLEGENISQYVYGTSKETSVINIDLEDTVYNACESGYEDMEQQFNYKSEKFIQAQKLINEWLEEHKEENTMYSEDTNIIIDLSTMIEEIKKELNL